LALKQLDVSSPTHFIVMVWIAKELSAFLNPKLLQISKTLFGLEQSAIS
jgi:hypothetical protein